MQRLPDWPIRLERFLRSSAERPFQYGVFDCALFACDAIGVMTGVDPARYLRGLYATRAEARKLLAYWGGFNAIAAANQMPEIAVTTARRGDVLLMRRSALGLMALNGRQAVVLTEKGLALAPIDSALKAWRV